MRGFQIASDPATGQGGSPRTYLDHLGIVSNLRYSFTFPGGPAAASWTLGVPAGFAHDALGVGRIVTIYAGVTPLWAGRVTKAARGEPWQFEAIGLGAMAKTIIPENTTVDNSIDYAVTNRGWPVTRGGVSVSGYGVSANAGANLDDTMTGALMNTGGAGKVWTVNGSGLIKAVDWPAVATHHVFPPGVPPVEVTTFGTVVQVTYVQSMAYGAQTATCTVSSTNTKRFGTFPTQLDITDWGYTSAGYAQAVGDAWLARMANQLNVTQKMIVAAGQLTTVGGTPVDLAVAKAGMRTRVQLVDSGHQMMALPQYPIETVISETEYDAVSELLTLTPYGTTERDLLAGITAPKDPNRYRGGGMWW